MKELIVELNRDHELIDRQLEDLEQLISETDFHRQLSSIQEQMQLFYDLSRLHHKREETVLYPWMLKQHSDSDKDLITKIIDDHRDLENRVLEIVNEIATVKESEDSSLGNLGYNISFLITKYREHASRESSFIFVIAESLSEASAH